ncbi:acyl-CoA dehydrogenase family protein [Vibrio harveyi]|nr:acyl-CoA dehydrogenase family protein [Vibrio harveyi]
MKSSYTPLNFGLGETIDMLRDHVNAFATEHIAPIAADIDRDNQFPNHLWSKLGDMGLLGVTVDEEFGGAGMGYLAHVVAMEEISRASASVALKVTAHIPIFVLTKSFAMAPLLNEKSTYLNSLMVLTSAH